MLAVAIGLPSLVFAGTEGLYENKVIGRDREKCTFISNMDWADIKQPLCREWLLNADRCRYIPLSDLGTFGKHHDELLPYKWIKDEWVILVNLATLTDEETALYSQLKDLMPLIPKTSGDEPEIRVFFQKGGKREYEVLIELPDEAWLEDAAEFLWSVPLADGVHNIDREERGWLPFTFSVNRLAVLTNMQSFNTCMNGARFANVVCFSPDQCQEFADMQGVTQRVIALNYNGDAEITPDQARLILPPKLHDDALEGDSDRLGLTPWQRFNRTAQARHFKNDTGGDTWFIGAPTEKFVNQLIHQTGFQPPFSSFEGRETNIKLCDASWMNSMAVGVYMQPENVDHERLVLRERLEQIARDRLGNRIPEISSGSNLGDVLQQVMGENDENPFRADVDVEHIMVDMSADALLVLWVRDISPTTSYDYEPKRQTPRMEPFSDQEPSKPNPDAKRPFGSHIYPGKNTEERRRSNKYQDDYDDYRRKHSDWEDRQASYNREARNRRITWQQNITARSSVHLSGYCKLIDLKSKQVVWSTAVETSQNGREKFIDQNLVTITGENATPDAPSMPPTIHRWEDGTFTAGQDAIHNALNNGLEKLQQVVLWGSDLKEWNCAQLPDHDTYEEQQTNDVESQKSDDNDQPPAPSISAPEIARELISLGDAHIVYRGEHCLIPAATVVRWAGGTVAWAPKTSTLDMSMPDGMSATVVMGRAAMLSSAGQARLPVAPETVNARAMIPFDVLKALGIDVEKNGDEIYLTVGDKHGYIMAPRS